MARGTRGRAGVRWCSAVALVLAVGLALVPPAASASFVPGRYVVEGQPLAKGAGSDLSVYLRPRAVTLDGCRTSSAKVRRARGGVKLRATIHCGKRTLKLVARVRGTRLRGKLVRRGNDRPVGARRARPVGTLLKGKRTARALGAIADVDRTEHHAESQISILDGRRIARREIVLRLKAAATVGQVNGVLQALGGGIASAVERSRVLVVGIPDPGSGVALRTLVKQIGRRAGIDSAELSDIAAPQELPAGVGSPPSVSQREALSHLLASGVAAAWNARGAATPTNVPTVAIVDNFGSGRPTLQLDAEIDPRQFVARGANPSDHGYHVAGIMLANFANNGSAAGLVTGVLPLRARLFAIDTSDREQTVTAAAQELLRAFGNGEIPGRVVLNTSLGHTPTVSDFQAREEAADWIRDTRALGLQGRVLHVNSAGNAAQIRGGGLPQPDTAARNGVWASAAVRTDIVDPITDAPLRPLDNTLSVEALDETPDASELACLIPTSNSGGTLGGPGLNVFSFNRLDGAINSSGTSMASPAVGGVAAYLWSIDETLTPQQLKTAIVDNAKPALEAAECLSDRRSANRLDAYAAVLSLDAPGRPAASGWRVRQALLDLDRSGRFDEQDLIAFAPKVAPTLQTPTRTWSRHDLNGDGFTGGLRTAPFDLDRTGSVKAGTTTLSATTWEIEGQPKTYDETAVRDIDVLCFYAYSALFQGDATSRRNALEGLCRPKVTVSPSTATVSPGAGKQFTATVSGASNTQVLWSATGGTITQTGRFTAGSTSGGFTVTATSLEDLGAKGTAGVTISSASVEILSRRSHTDAAAQASAVTLCPPEGGNPNDTQDDFDPDPPDSQDFTGAGPILQTRHATATASRPGGIDCPSVAATGTTDHSADHDAAVDASGIDLSLAGTWTVDAEVISGERAGASSSGQGFAELDVSFQTAGPLGVNCAIDFPADFHTNGQARILLDGVQVAETVRSPPSTPRLSFATTVSSGQHRLQLQAFPGGDGGTSSTGTYALVCTPP